MAEFFTHGINAIGHGLIGYIVPFLFVLTIVVFFHELGHFLVARWTGVKVLTFSLGFGPELLGFNDRKGTRWKISAVPLGGYVKFFGDENEASAPSAESLAAMSEDDRKVSFHHKNVFARAAIVAAGPIANFILAILIFAAFVLIFGKQVVAPRIDSVTAGTAAAAAGFKPGDVVVAIDGKPIESYSDVQRAVGLNAGRKLTFDVNRNGTQVSLSATPVARDERDRFGNVARIGALDISGPTIPARVVSIQPKSAAERAGFQPGDLVRAIDGKPVASFADLRDIVTASPDKTLDFSVDRGGRLISVRATPIGHDEKGENGTKQRIGQLGLQADYDPADTRLVRFGLFDALGNGVTETWFVIDRTVSYIAGVFVGREAADQVGGPIRIAQLSGQVATMGVSALINLAAALSVSIGLLNLFPVPLLDGGHLLFYSVEVVRGRPLSERAQEMGFRIGLALVLMLMIFATYNDILHLTAS
jgi:regulator of sigma E protease